MKFIADTHAFLWFISDSPQLSKRAKSILESSENERLLSAASIWEMAIKESLGKLSAGLPLFHRDPFDRLILAQALVAELPIVSNDSALDAYGIRRLW